VTVAAEQALEVLCSDALAPAVEMVLHSPAPDRYQAISVDGSIDFTRHPGPRHAPEFSVTRTDGHNPLGAQRVDHLAPLADELGNPQPDRAANSYPLAFERIAQLFDHDASPDLYVLHTAAHRWEGHFGEHGSLSVVQSRAPFIAAGCGIRHQGLVPRHCRMVDVAPTVLALLGLAPDAGGQHLSCQDGAVVDDLTEPGGPVPEHVLTVLLDGANANVLYDAAASKEAPNLASLIAVGTAFAHGALASLPTVTLPNHTTLMTGAHPGHHGVLHNAWFDRALGRTIVTESPATWHEAMNYLRPGVETVHEAIHRRMPGAVTVAVNEPADRGADYSTMDVLRSGDVAPLQQAVPRPVPHADQSWYRASDAYRWGSLVDASAVVQAVGLWSGELLGRTYGLPTFCWVSFSLTDSAFHEGGPHSEMARCALRDTDARLGEVLAAVDRAGALDRTAVLIVADHGMEQVGSETTEGWGPALDAAGIGYRDEASGFLYLTS
jgi:predicted AlkP superfamily pyrophosphatase or phosphodiesterase